MPSRFSLRTLLQLVVIGLVVYLLLAGFAGLGRSWQAIQHAQSAYIGGSMILIAMSYVAAAITYKLLAARPVPLLPTLMVQISGGLVNRLLPAGLGGLGINAIYLKRQGHTLPVASTIVATNNALGFVGNMVLIAIVVGFSSLTLAQLHLPHIPWLPAAAIFCVVLVSGWFILKWYKKAALESASIWRAILGYFRHVGRQPGSSFGALLSSCALTALHASAVYLIVLSVHYPVSWPIALVAVSAGSFMGAAVPTPGGLGGAEAGIAGALIAFGMPSAEAAAAALIYRGLSYWLPLVPGYVALRIVERRYI